MVEVCIRLHGKNLYNDKFYILVRVFIVIYMGKHNKFYILVRVLIIKNHSKLKSEIHEIFHIGITFIVYRVYKVIQ